MVYKAKAIVKKKEGRVTEISKKLAKGLFEEKNILLNSVTCSEAIYRLEKYLKWTITEEVKARFALFMENRK